MSNKNAIATQALRIYRQGNIELARAIWSDAIESVRLKNIALATTVTHSKTQH